MRSRYFDMFSSILIQDLREYFRVPLIVVSSSLLPVTMVISFGIGQSASVPSADILEISDSYFEFILPGILAVGTLFSTVNAGGYVQILDRQKQVILDLIVSPVPYFLYITTRLIGILIKCSVQNLLTLCLGLFFLEDASFHPFYYLANYVFSGIIFGVLGMILGALSGVLTFPGISSVFLIPLMYLCGVFLPVSSFSVFLSPVLLLPFSYTVDLFRFALTGNALLVSPALGLGILVIFSLVAVRVWVFIFEKKVRSIL